MKKSVLILAIPLVLLGVWFFIKKLRGDVLIEFEPQYFLGLRSKTENELKQIALVQFNAMRNPGTDEKIIFSSLDGLNNADLVSVYNYFGKRGYWIAGDFPIALGGSANDLMGWYKEELSKTSRLKMYEIWKDTDLPTVFLLKDSVS